MDAMYDAYTGLKGELSQKHIKDKIDWLISMADDATYIFDVGCSQGIISFLLAKRAKKIVGIDINSDAIKFANTLLESPEYKDCQDFLSFKHADFNIFNLDDNNNKPDCIIMGEVLEYIDDPMKFLKHAVDIITPSGKIIITSSFGISDHPDRKHTFYMKKISDMISVFFDVLVIKHFDGWVGFCATYKGAVKETFTIGAEQIAELEDAFYLKDKQLTYKVKGLYNNLIELSSKYYAVRGNYDVIEDEHAQYLKSSKDKIAGYIKDMSEANTKYRMSTENYATLKAKYNQHLEDSKVKSAKHREEMSEVSTKYRTVKEDYATLKAKYIQHLEDSEIKLAKQHEEMSEANTKYCTIAENHMTLEAKYIQCLEDSEVKLAKHCKELSEANTKYRTLVEIYTTLESKCTQHLEESTTKITKLIEELPRYVEKLSFYKEENEELKNENTKYREKILQYAEHLNVSQNEGANYLNETTQYAEKLNISVTEFGNALSLLRTADATINRLSAQIRILKNENEQYQNKLRRITSTWYGKIALKCYHTLRSIKRRFIKV